MTLFFALFTVFFMCLLKWPQLVMLAVRLWVHLFVQASVRAKCPGCGVRAKHRVKYSSALQKLVHLCEQCGAPWAEQCMVSPAQWQVAMVVDDEDVDKDGVRTTQVQTAQRTPQLVTQYTPTGNNKPVVVRLPMQGGMA